MGTKFKVIKIFKKIKNKNQFFTFREPIEVFDLGSPVADCAWAPYSSTVFAAITTDGRVCVWDLNINKTLPLCDQKISFDLSESKLTRFEFNAIHPIIIVGDDK